MMIPKMRQIARENQSTLLFLAFWLILLFAGRGAMFRDPGTFWHTADGEKILTAGHLIHEDSFSFTRAGRAWVSDQWLAEVGMALIHRAAGWDGLLLASVTLLASLYAWLGARLLRSGLHILPTMLLLALAMLAGAPQFHVRPLLLTLALLGVTFAMLVDVEAGRRRFRSLWWLVPLFILWTNLHAGVLGGLGTAALCIGGWCLSAACRLGKGFVLGPGNKQVGELHVGRISESVTEDSTDSEIRPTKWHNLFFPIALPSILLLLALFATTLCNPCGLALPCEWLETLAMPLAGIIEEHAPLNFAEPVGWGTAALAAFYLATLLGVLPQRCSVRITWLLPLVWLVLALMCVRNASLFAVTTVIATADMLPYSFVGRWLERRGMLVRDPLHALPTISIFRFLPVVVVAAAIVVQLVGRGWARFDTDVCPMELLPTIEEINRSSPEGERVFNDMRFGGFLIYHAPRLRIFIDDRCPLYGTEFLSAYQRAQNEEPAQLDHWREEYGFRYALVASGGRFDEYLSTAAGWKLVERARAAALYWYKPPHHAADE